MTLTDEQVEQLEFIDDVLRYISFETLKDKIEESKLVEKLKGAQMPHNSVVIALKHTIDYQQTKISELEKNQLRLEYDIQRVVRILAEKHRLSNESTTDLNSLCSQHGVWL